MADPRYLAPGWFTRNVFNRAIAGLTRIGVSVYGSRILVVRGRTTGLPRSVPVNVLTYEGNRYLVAPRGTTQWVRNLRAAGEGALKCGRRTEQFRATEIPDEENYAASPPTTRSSASVLSEQLGQLTRVDLGVVAIAVVQQDVCLGVCSASSRMRGAHGRSSSSS